MKRLPLLLSALVLLARPARADGLRVRLELWELPATEVAQRMDAGGAGEAWLTALRKDALAGKLPGVKLVGSSALALAANRKVYQGSTAEWIYPMEFEPGGLGALDPKDPARMELWSAVPDTFESRMTGHDLTVQMRPASDTAHWRVTLSGSTSVMHGMRALGDPRLEIFWPLFDFMRLDQEVTLRLSQWRVLFLNPVPISPPPGRMQPGPANDEAGVAATRQVRRLALIRLEPNE